MQSSGKIGLSAVLIIAVCVAAVIAHWPALSAKALSFDDQQYLTKNILVQNPSFKSAKRFLTEVLNPSTVAGYYQPLTMISLMLNYAAGGNENNLRPFHATSLALHAANTALIIVLLNLLFGNIWAAAAAGLLFGVHPMTVEPIPWVGERKTLLAAFFAFWSLIFYVRYSRSGNWKSYAGSFVMYLLALMSKPTSVPLPAVMLLMDYWPLKRLRIKSFLEKIPLFILSVAFVVITYISQSRAAGTELPAKFGPERIPLTLCHNIIFYLYKIVLPINLSSHYAFPKPFNLAQPMILAGLLGTCMLIPLLLISLRWTQAAFTGWLIFFVAIFPTMGVIGFTIVIASDKYAYLPAIGLLMALTSLLIWFCSSNKRKIAAVFIVLILASSEAAATQRYLVYWQDSITLNNRMLTLAPDAAPLYNNRGVAYNAKNMHDLAIADFNKALEINPRSVEAYNNRGNAYAKGKAEFDRAIADYNKAIEIYPKYADAHYNLGMVYNDTGNYDLAITAYSSAIKIDPRYAMAYNNRGNAHYAKGEYDLAMSDYNKAIEINPKLIEARYNRALARFATGEYDRAIGDYNKVLEINARDAEAYLNRGNVYAQGKGEYDSAIADYNKALEINPRLVDAYLNKAFACENAGRRTEAIEAYKAFIQYAPAEYASYVEQARQRIKTLEH